MNSPANVRSLEAIREIKVAVDLFREQVSEALAAARQEIYRMVDWLENDRPIFWRRQVQNDSNRVAAAKSRLATCKRRKMGDFRPSCIEEEQELQQAKRKLQNDREKVELVQNWKIKFRREFEEYQGQIVLLQNFLDNDIRNSSALLVRILNSLEQYVDIPSGSFDLGTQKPETEKTKETAEKKLRLGIWGQKKGKKKP